MTSLSNSECRFNTLADDKIERVWLAFLGAVLLQVAAALGEQVIQRLIDRRALFCLAQDNRLAFYRRGSAQFFRQLAVVERIGLDRSGCNFGQKIAATGDDLALTFLGGAVFGAISG